jgi:hypothetical protein
MNRQSNGQKSSTSKATAATRWTVCCHHFVAVCARATRGVPTCKSCLNKTLSLFQTPLHFCSHSETSAARVAALQHWSPSPPPPAGIYTATAELSAGLPHSIFRSHPFPSSALKAHDMATPAPRGQIRFVAVGRKSDGASGAVVVASHVFYTAGALPAK